MPAKKVPMIVPKHGRGKLRLGGGNGISGPGSLPGRPKDVIREAMRGELDSVLGTLKEKHEAGELDELKYAEFLARYGIGTQSEADVTVRETPQAVTFRRQA